MSDYFVEDTESLPFATSVKLYESHLPRWAAAWLAGWLRFRKLIGLPVRPLYAARWSPQVQWQTREAMPAQALSRWAPILEQLLDLGFEPCGWVSSDTIGCKAESHAFLLNEAGRTLATILWVRIGDTEQTTPSFTSYGADGSEFVTAALPEDQLLLVKTLMPDYITMVSAPSRTPVGDLYRLHAERAERAASIPLTMHSFAWHYERQRLKLFEHSCAKGSIRHLSDREVRALKAR